MEEKEPEVWEAGTCRIKSSVIQTVHVCWLSLSDLCLHAKAAGTVRGHEKQSHSFSVLTGTLGYQLQIRASFREDFIAGHDFANIYFFSSLCDKTVFEFFMFHKKDTGSNQSWSLSVFAPLALAELAAKTHRENCIFERWHFLDEGRGGKKSVWLKKGLLSFKCCSQWMKGKPAAMPKSFQVSVFIQHWTR